MRAKFSIVAAAGILACIGAAWLATHHPPHRPTEPGGLLTVVVGISLLGSGITSWRARPENRLGPVMVLTAFAWFAGQLTELHSPLGYTTGVVVQYVWVIGLLYLVLTFPAGRLETNLDRGLIVATFLVGFGLPLLAMLYGKPSTIGCDAHCPANLLRIYHNDQLARGLLGLEKLIAAPLLAGTIARLILRWRRASTAQQRAVAPVVVTGSLTLAALTVTVTLDLFGDPLQALPAEAFFYSFATVPLAVVYVWLQRRLARGNLAGLVVELGAPTAPADLTHALARTLGDPSLQLAFWFAAERCYVDGDGTPVRLPEESDEERASTFVVRDGQPIAVLVHDPALEEEAELVESVCAAASLALENERLQAELRARLVELQASRARLVDATDTERRRIERNLHDGTQQRLVSIAMSLGLAESRLPRDPQAAQPLVQESRTALSLALQELRELTHGINPPLLVERGLAAALDELSRRAGLPTRLEVDLGERPASRIESAAYFVASEALANAAKHSHGSEVRMRVVSDGMLLVLEIADDGIGGAAPSGGSGLRGLADRIEALGGTLTVASPPGRGTRLRAEIPCG